MFNTNAVNEYNFERRDLARFFGVRDFYERLWIDAMADEGVSEYKPEWFEEWCKTFKPTKDILVKCLDYAGETEDFLEFYAIDVQLNMRKVINGKKSEIS